MTRGDGAGTASGTVLRSETADAAESDTPCSIADDPRALAECHRDCGLHTHSSKAAQGVDCIDEWLVTSLVCDRY